MASFHPPMNGNLGYVSIHNIRQKKHKIVIHIIEHIYVHLNLYATISFGKDVAWNFGIL